jgi:hypothetical protein
MKREFRRLVAEASVGIESFDALRLSFLLDPLARLDPAVVAPLTAQKRDTI